MKKFLLILLTIIILLAGGICGLYLNLESIVKASVAKYGSQLTGTEVALDGFRLSLRKGEAELKGLRIANPEGYQTPQILSLGSVYVRLDMRSLLKPIIVVEEIRIANPEIAYELKSVAHNNVSDLPNPPLTKPMPHGPAPQSPPFPQAAPRNQPLPQAAKKSSSTRLT